MKLTLEIPDQVVQALPADLTPQAYINQLIKQDLFLDATLGDDGDFHIDFVRFKSV